MDGGVLEKKTPPLTLSPQSRGEGTGEEPMGEGNRH